MVRMPPKSDAYRKTLEATARKPGKIRRMEGDVQKAIADADRVMEASYWSPHFVHAPMEVPAAVADVRDDRAEIWACCQDAQALRATAAAALEMDPASVTARVTLLGGAIGRAAGRERVGSYVKIPVVAGLLKKKK